MAVLFLHGSGDTGPNFQAWVEALAPSLLPDLEAAGVQCLFPSAQARPYTMAGGQTASVWHDRAGLGPGAGPEDVEGAADSAARLRELLAATGVPESRTVVGGFSQGGGMAMQLAAGQEPAYAGLFAMGSFLLDESVVWRSRFGADAVLQMHGLADGLISEAWGRRTATRLQEQGVPLEYGTEAGLDHEMSASQLAKVRGFIETRLGLSAPEEDL